MDGAAFAVYVEKVRVPELSPGTVIIPNYLATHKSAVAAKAMRDAACLFLFLPLEKISATPPKACRFQVRLADKCRLECEAVAAGRQGFGSTRHTGSFYRGYCRLIYLSVA